MRIVLAVALVTSLYLIGSIIAIAQLPAQVVQTPVNMQAVSPDTVATIAANERNSVRSSLVAVLTGSVLGTTGIAAVAGFYLSRRSGRLAERELDNDLYTKALPGLASNNSLVTQQSIQILAEVGRRRPEFLSLAISAIVSTIRARLAATSASTKSSNDTLLERDPVASTAIELLGSLSEASNLVNFGSAFVAQNLSGCDLSGAVLTDYTYTGVNFNQTFFSRARLVRVTFEACSFTSSQWDRANLVECEFVGCDLTGSGFQNASFGSSTTRGCVGVPSSLV